MSGEDEYPLGELDRRLANVVRIATIETLDEANGLVKVDFGEHISDWLQWTEHRAGPGVRTWSMPELGEQVMVFAPGGELSQGVVGPSLFQNAFAQNANLKTTHRTDYADGTVVEYDRVAHAMKMELNAAGNFLFNVGGSKIEMNTSRIKLTSNGSTLEMDAAGIRLNGARIDLN